MLSIGYFNKSSLKIKASEVFKRGSFIDYFKIDGETISLYSLDTFYVEVSLGENHKVLSVIGISPEGALSKY